MENIEKLEYKLQIMLKYKENFYADNLKLYAAAKICISSRFSSALKSMDLISQGELIWSAC